MKGRILTKSRGDTRRTSIIAAATRLLAGAGASRVSMDEIGAEAGLNGPAIYRYFSGKGEMLDAVIVESAARLSGLLVLGASTGKGNPGKRLRKSVTMLVSVVLAHGDQCTVLQREHGNCTPAVQAEITDLWDSIVGTFVSQMVSLRPDLGKHEAEARFNLVFAGLSAIARQRSTLSKKRAEELISESLLAVLSERPGKPLELPVQGWKLEPDRREAILQAAICLFAENGFDGVRIEDIGAAAGVSGPAVYRHYGSKADILIDIFELGGADMISKLRDALIGATSAMHALQRFADYSVRNSSRDPAAIKVYNRNWNALPRDAHDRIAKWREYSIEIWARVLAEARHDVNGREASLLVTGGFKMQEAVGHTFNLDPTDLLLAWFLGRTYEQQSGLVPPSGGGPIDG